MEKIAIFTTLANFDESYSLVSVITHQARILKEFSGLDVEIWVLMNCKDDYPEDLKDNVKKVIPCFEWVNDVVNDSMIPIIQNVLQDGINKGVKHFICHDILLVSSYITYNEALRRIAGINPGVKWYHWMHSGPSNRPASLSSRVDYLKYTMPPNSSLVYLNYYDHQRAANMYEGVTTSNSHVVYNPVYPYNLTSIEDEVAINISNSIDFKSARIRCIYPFSSTRIDAKRVLYVLEMLNIIKSRGYDVRFIACNCHANAQNERNVVEALLRSCTKKPFILDKKDILFTSTYKFPKYEYSLPHSTIIDLFKLSNLFIFPTISEVCPLILQEAALTNNLIVANADFPSLMEITGPDGALFFQFGSILNNVRYGANNTEADRRDYFNWCVDNIIPALDKGLYQTNAMFNVLNNYNYKRVWEKQLKPMLGV